MKWQRVYDELSEKKTKQAMKYNLRHNFKFIKKKLRSKKYTLANMEKC